MSVNIDDRLLKIGNNTTNEIETVYELLKVSIFGNEHAITDNNELNEDKTNIISYFDNSSTPTIPSKKINNLEQKKTTPNIEGVKSIVVEITPPPPKC